MSYELTESERQAVAALSADERYDYFVQKVVEGGEVWSLQSEDGWVQVTAAHGEVCLPVWPHREYAAQWVSAEWANYTPSAIPLDAWMDRWTPGMERDGTLLAVFPDGDAQGVVVAPVELLAAIDIECSLQKA